MVGTTEYEGDYPKAKNKFETVLTLTKDIESLDGKLLGNAHFHLGMIYREISEKGKAIFHLKKCLKMIPDHQKAGEILGILEPIRK